MKKNIWNILYLTPPHVLRYCKKCGKKTEFFSSGLFRVNAQRKYLDIWLIYKCNCCETTWNATVSSRVTPQSVPSGLLEKYTNNDRDLAEKYAMNIDFLHKNGAEIVLPDYRIDGDCLQDQKVQLLEIKNQFPVPVKLSAIIRKKLNLSQKQYLNVIESEKIKSTLPLDFHKFKLKNSIILEIHDYPFCDEIYSDI